MSPHNALGRAMRGTGARRATVVTTVVALLATGAVLKAMPAAGQLANPATSAGRFTGLIDWMTWGNDGAALADGATSTSTRTIAGQTLSTVCTLSQPTGRPLNAYVSGDFGGDSLDDMYNVGGAGAANTLVNAIRTSSGIADFHVSCDTTLDGNPVPMSGLVMADAEQSTSGQGGEYVQAAGEGTWRIIDWFRSAGCTQSSLATVSTIGTQSTLHLAGSGLCGAGPASVGFLQAPTPASTLDLDAELRGGGTSAIALGVVLPTDFGDAPASYGSAGSVYSPGFSGGNAITTNTPVPGTTGAFPLATMIPPALRLGGTVDSEQADQPSVDADADGSDEDGLLSGFNPTSFTTGAQYQAIVACAGTGDVNGWIDWNHDGAFTSDEKSVVAACGNGPQVALRWIVPVGATTPAPVQHTYLRLRIAPTGQADSPTGLTTAGEVEDYADSALAPLICQTSRSFFGIGSNTQLTELIGPAAPPPPFSFQNIGITTNNFEYNALAYREADHFFYADEISPNPGQILRIDAGGVAAELGQPGTGNATFNAGAIGADGLYYVWSSAANGMHSIDVSGTTPSLAEVDSNTTGAHPADGALIGQHFFGAVNGTIVRLEPGPGPTVTTNGAGIVPAGVDSGGAWTFGNGNLGLWDNTNGTIYEVHVDDPDGTPTYTLVFAAGGPKNGIADATSCAGAPVDLSITKTATTPVQPNGQITYTLTVTNNSSGPSGGSVVNDTIPVGLTNVATTTDNCTITPAAPPPPPATQTVSCLHGTLNGGAGYSITITATAPSTDQTVSNSAEVIGNEPDPVADNNVAGADTDVATAPDLSLTKTADASVSVGEEATFTLTVHNGGPVNSIGDTVVTDAVPPGITDLTLDASAPAGCGFSGSLLTCTLPPGVAPGVANDVVITFTGIIGVDSARPVVNHATLTGGGDITPNDNTGTSTTEVQTADLRLSKSGPATVNFGEDITWTMTIHNNGPGIANGATLTDTVPASITPTTVSAPASAHCTRSGQTVTCYPEAIAGGDEVVVQVTGHASNATVDSATNSATVDQPGDPNTSNNTAAFTTQVLHADLSVQKTAPEHVTTGGQIQWLITVHNAGPVAAVGATLRDAIPAGLVNVHLAPAVPGCAVANGALDCAFAPIPPNTDVPITLVGDTTHPGTVSNTVTVTQPGDPNTANNTARAVTRVSRPDTVDNAPEPDQGPHHAGGSGYPPCEQHSTDPGHCSGPKKH